MIKSFFTTDNKGYFDVTNDGNQGRAVAWPSYDDGSGYIGPKLLFAKSSSQTTDKKLVTHTIVYDTAYTTPYH